MSRKIRFRAWNKQTNKMIDLYGITPLALEAGLKQDGIFVPFGEDWPLMQLIGIEDKNGKEIYEGDIVKFYLGHNDPLIGQVIWYQHGWFFKCEYLCPNKEIRAYAKMRRYDEKGNKTTEWNYTEIIGNVCENPELLVK